MSNQVLKERLNQTIELISTRLEELIKLAAIGTLNLEEEEENSYGSNNSSNAGTNSNSNLLVENNSEINIATTSLSMVNTQTMQLIKGIEDLLVLSRNIKEKWLLTQIPKDEEENELDYEMVEQLLDGCMNELIGE
ncbi:hypothetical protein TBLA_0J01640 [Henningerozyma blattae CBS 6284]|uniref:Mediator of RNA polymerase II transcription subunit 22 n=1 Tax=Henningerozyma blattae (strain ATCC 34711 / CBS 6284 / DSM 70876 / NBRC 10599 / NRRL Y-10934 / UCD 77-7) TaxID=1071380 RepID=I2H9V7_HENB6|nr:hypothetical protein TBLA_0J01640 [Tetrapisispora blattae CBS 6284]CCH63159.1 hypothetical protein TBLA_0J01640 [Tetrapisispora blattae CBS 6284]